MFVNNKRLSDMSVIYRVSHKERDIKLFNYDDPNVRFDLLSAI